MTGYLGILLEELFEESAKTDFRDKFGEKTLQNFDKANQRLKNNGYSTDYGQYLKMSQEEIDNLILSLYDDKKDAQRKRMIKGEDKEIRGKYNYLGEKGGYKIYQPLDVQASMDLGVNTGWCTTGRYGHYGHPEFTPSEEEATRHFDEYTKDNGIKLYYFLNPQTMYGEYAVAVYPKTLYPVIHINGIYVNSTNFELFDAKDQLDYSAITKLPLDVIPNIDISAYKLDTVIGYPESLELLSIEEARELPKSAMRYEASWWLRSPGYISYKVAYTNLGGGIVDVGDNVFYGSRAVCPSLKISNPEPSNLELYKKYNVNNEFIGVYIGDNKFLYKGKAIKLRFDRESNNYETSEIKQYLDNWLKELQSKSKDMKESLNKGNTKMTLNEYKKTRKKNLTEKLDLNMYDDCWVEFRDGEPTFCYDTLKDCRAGIMSSRRGDWYYGDGEVHDYIIKRWENGKLYDVDEKTNEVIYENLKEEHINEGIDVESTGKSRMPLYKAMSAVQKFNEDAKAYPYWVIKSSKWYDPEGLNIQDKDYNIEYAGTEQECKDKISQIIDKANNNKYGDMVIEDYSDTFVKIYYPHAISKAVFSVIKNPHMNESLKENFYWDEEDSFFTRDDLDEFQAELEYELPEVVFHKTYFEPGNSLEVDWDYEGWEETTKVRVDMRRIRYPRDLIRRYAPIVIGMIKDSYEKMERELNESYLKEDWDSLRDLAEEMINYLNDNGVSWVDIYNINDDGPLSSITLEIDGDWKHDHLRANYLLNMKYGDRIKSIQDYSLEDTGSDWGKEAHVIRLK